MEKVIQETCEYLCSLIKKRKQIDKQISNLRHEQYKIDDQYAQKVKDFEEEYFGAFSYINLEIFSNSIVVRYKLPDEDDEKTITLS